MLAPGRAVLAEVAAERLLTPRHLPWRNDRGKGRDAAEAIGMVESDGERAVPAHRMTGDGLPGFVDRELRRDERRQLLGHIGPHLVMARPGLLGRIDVEARAQAEVP